MGNEDLGDRTRGDEDIIILNIRRSDLNTGTRGIS
jgi:hypothetical protein